MQAGSRLALVALVLLMLLHPFVHTHAEQLPAGASSVDDESLVRDCPCVHAFGAPVEPALSFSGVLPVTQRPAAAPESEPVEIQQGKIPARAPPVC